MSLFHKLFCGKTFETNTPLKESSWIGSKCESSFSQRMNDCADIIDVLKKSECYQAWGRSDGKEEKLFCTWQTTQRREKAYGDILLRMYPCTWIKAQTVSSWFGKSISLHKLIYQGLPTPRIRKIEMTALDPALKKKKEMLCHLQRKFSQILCTVIIQESAWFY